MRTLGKTEIDAIVIAKAEDDAAWERPLRVRRKKKASLSLPIEVAERVAFFAQLHRHASAEDWLNRIIQERLELEEAAFAGVKRELAKSRV